MESLKIFMKIFNVICNTIMTIIIIFGIVFVGLFCFGIVPYVVESGSMEPTIHTGSVCFVNRKAEYGNMQVGDIIAFELGDGACATHRIVSVSKDGLETKGDANSAIDSIVTTKDNFLGENIFSIPKAGFVIKDLQSAKGKVILVTVIVALFTLAFLTGKKK